MEEKLDKVKVWAETHKTGGVGYLGWLSLIFIVLKLTGYINWPWWYVLAPIWIPFAIVFGLLTLILVALAIVTCFSKRQSKDDIEEDTPVSSYTIIISKDEIASSDEESKESKENTTSTNVKKKRSRRKPKAKENGGEGTTTKESGDTQGDAVTDK